MTKISESGHAKNVATFEDLISFCTAYGTAYNPSKNSIKLPAMNTLLAAAREPAIVPVRCYTHGVRVMLIRYLHVCRLVCTKVH